MSAVEIKICGITRVEDALAALDLRTNDLRVNDLRVDDPRVTMLGVNFYQNSPRCIPLEQAREIARAVAGRARLVGVFVNMNIEDVLRIARAVPLDAVQLHGDESPRDCELAAREFEVIRAFHIDAAFSAGRVAEFAACRGILLDAPCAVHGGSGESFHWTSVPWAEVRRALPAAKVFLAGGLHAGNVGAAIAAAHPDVVDVCSGVESAKGIKSVSRMRDFVAAVRAAERQEQ
jgi:phosphoribosylanthranilate isomerase